MAMGQPCRSGMGRRRRIRGVLEYRGGKEREFYEKRRSVRAGDVMILRGLVEGFRCRDVINHNTMVLSLL